MNRGEIEEMRQRLEARSASIGEENPVLAWVGALLMFALVFLMSFL